MSKKSTRFKSNMPMIKKSKKQSKMGDDICAQCGWRRKDHKVDHKSGYPFFCYDYSDQDTDYFHNDRGFVPQPPKGVTYSRAFNGKIIL